MAVSLQSSPSGLFGPSSDVFRVRDRDAPVHQMRCSLPSIGEVLGASDPFSASTQYFRPAVQHDRVLPSSILPPLSFAAPPARHYPQVPSNVRPSAPALLPAAPYRIPHVAGLPSRDNARPLPSSGHHPALDVPFLSPSRGHLGHAQVSLAPGSMPQSSGNLQIKPYRNHALQPLNEMELSLIERKRKIGLTWEPVHGERVKQALNSFSQKASRVSGQSSPRDYQPDEERSHKRRRTEDWVDTPAEIAVARGPSFSSGLAHVEELERSSPIGESEADSAYKTGSFSSEAGSWDKETTPASEVSDISGSRTSKADDGSKRCSACHRTKTVEWRRGPEGPHTLCNACGLHYAKIRRQWKMYKRSITSES